MCYSVVFLKLIFLQVFKKKKGKDLKKDNRAVQKLRREVEKAKRALSTAHQVRLEIESLYDGEDFSETLTRAKFEELNMDLFRSTLKPVEKVTFVLLYTVILLM